MMSDVLSLADQRERAEDRADALALAWQSFKPAPTPLLPPITATHPLVTIHPTIAAAPQFHQHALIKLPLGQTRRFVQRIDARTNGYWYAFEIAPGMTQWYSEEALLKLNEPSVLAVYVWPDELSVGDVVQQGGTFTICEIRESDCIRWDPPFRNGSYQAVPGYVAIGREEATGALRITKFERCPQTLIRLVGGPKVIAAKCNRDLVKARIESGGWVWKGKRS